MNRRNYLKTLMAASGGLIALPSWAREWTAADMISSNSSTFSVVEQDMLASVADTVIPAGNSIGAISVGVDKFLQRLFENCYEADVQQNIKTQLQGLNGQTQKTFGKSFPECDQQQRQETLLRMATSQDKAEKDFFDLLKSETIRGFNTSKEVMLGYLNYKQVPGHYYGCVDVKA